MVENLRQQMERIDTLHRAFNIMPIYSGKPLITEFLKTRDSDSMKNVVNNSSPVEINIGDTVIHGNADKETVQAHTRVTYDMVDEIARMLRVGR